MNKEHAERVLAFQTQQESLSNAEYDLSPQLLGKIDKFIRLRRGMSEHEFRLSITLLCKQGYVDGQIAVTKMLQRVKAK